MFIPNPNDYRLTMGLNNGEYPVICICGSTRFREDIYLAYERLTRAGWITLGVCPVMREGDDPLTAEEYQNIVDMHYQKMHMADAIYVVNKGGYIGESTRSEITHAKDDCIPIFYMEGDA